MNRIELRNIIVVLSLIVGCASSITLIFLNRLDMDIDVFGAGILASGLTSLFVVTTFLASMYAAPGKTPGYIFTFILGSTFSIVGVWNLGSFPQDYAVIIGSVICAVSAAVPLGQGRFAAKNQAQAQGSEVFHRDPMEFFGNFLWIRLHGVKVQMISSEEVLDHKPSRGILWAKAILDPEEHASAAFVEWYKIDWEGKLPDELTVGNLTKIFQSYLLSTEELTFQSMSGLLRKTKKQMEENGCPGKFFLAHPGGFGMIYGVIFCRHCGILMTYQRSVASILAEKPQQ